ncbi:MULTISPECIES: PhzF family phenazine biosynthesis protein [Bacillus]|uniref:PhzF family phenazine biosynthesis protein n=1 Tax=Bacillus TaxID=1386 RepID=UPI00065DDF76|nr:PhzF family phenazine biosynthesis protein [Bacillus smithii]AKP47042.1 Phenazine biosynthesis protein PhzF like [Bacillus smithii]MED4884576.1 PhzF family phenazine biosynthesis protein [Bacillus smithii]MED4927787.1 PhzF family phenazine biosynthesis protein [Bacillus smithii]
MNIFLINAFTDQPFAGNAAAVCFLPESKDAGWMQKVAKEIHLPTTAFIKHTNGKFSLRWFTPSMEIPLCGHGTLASAYVLWEMGYIKAENPVSFSTKSGVLTATVKNGWIELDFPSAPDHEINAPDRLIQALGVVPKYVGKNQLDYIVEVESDDVVKNLIPDIDSIAQLPIRGVIVTSRSSSGRFDFISRLFSPAQGIVEDAVTGSAHCCLGPYWKRRLNKDEFIAYQASARGGMIKVKMANNRVLLSGKAVTVIKGELFV